MRNTTHPPTIGIITALPKEYVAVKALIADGQETFVPGVRGLQRYLVGRVPAANGAEHVVVAALLTDMGNNSAAIRATLLLEHFQGVRSILMGGIAGGIPQPGKASEHVRLGDIVVSDRNGVVQYDLDKETISETVHRHPPRPPSASLLNGVRHLEVAALEGRRPWEPFIAEAARHRSPRVKRPPDASDVLVSTDDPHRVVPHPRDSQRQKRMPRVFSGAIASANKLLKNPAKRDALRDQFGVKAVEMEGSGIADATWTHDSGYLVIRSICDYCDANKGDRWQDYAAVVAAAYMRALLEVMPAQDANGGPPGPDNLDSDLPRRGSGVGATGPSAWNPAPSSRANDDAYRGSGAWESRGDARLGAPPIGGGTWGEGVTIASRVLDRTFDRLAAHTADEAKERLRAMRRALREGRRADAATDLARLKGDPVLWETILPADVRADVLRFAAALALEASGNADEADQLLALARDEAPGDDARISAMVTRTRSGSRAALTVLEGREDAESLVVKAAFHLDLGEARSCLKVLEGVPAEGDVYTDALRLRSLAYLLDRRPDQALTVAQDAYERERRWLQNRYALATACYYSALVPAALPDRILSWPEPAAWEDVKGGLESAAHLQRALDLFDDLAADAADGSDERHSARVWAMACLANDRERQGEAVTRCRALLKVDAGDPHAIAWSIVREYDIDLKPSARHIEGLVSDKRASLPHVIALVAYYVHGLDTNATKATRLLKRPWVKDLFEGQGAERMWRFWHIKALVAAGTPENALGALDAIADAMSYPELRREKTAVLYAIARKTDEWSALIEHLERSYSETDDPDYLLTCCTVMAQRRDWTYIVDRAATLVTRCGTEKAVRLAAAAAYHACHFKLGFDLLDRHLDLFAGHRLPADLARIRIACMDALGMRLPAIAEAEAIAAAEPTAANILALLDLYRRVGNLPAMVHHARRLRPLRALTALQALQAARLVRHDDPGLARDLWRRAVEQGDLPDGAVGDAWALGFQLGCDDELRPLMPRLMAPGGPPGGIEILNAVDLPAMLQRQRTRQEEMARMYIAGTAPISIAAWSWRRSLVSLYHDDLLARAEAPNPLRQPALLARHGGRPITPGFPANAPAWRLHLDVTALLLAAHLDVLAAVERAFGPVYIAGDIMDDLLGMRDNLAIHQPSRQPIYDRIIALEAKRALRADGDAASSGPQDGRIVDELGGMWASLYARACEADGYIVDYLPLRRPGLEGLLAAPPVGVSERVVNCRAVIEALRERKVLTDAERDEAIVKLGQEGLIDVTSPRLPLGATLFCHGNTPEVLAEAGILPEVCAHFDVRIERSELDRVRTAIRDIGRAQQNIAWLTEVIGQVNRGIDAGAYLFVASPHDDADHVDIPAAVEGERSLRTMLQLRAESGDVLWVDDRFLTGYTRQEGGMPIIGIIEVLKALVGAGELSEGSYYAALLTLRASNVRFVPVEADEILYHLGRAAIDPSAKVIHEGEALAVLRRYVAACLTQGDILQRPPVADSVPNKDGEIAFVLGIKEAVADALPRLWEMDDDDEVCRMRADWLVRAMFLDLASLNALMPIVRQGTEPLQTAAISLARLLSPRLSIMMGSQVDRPTPRHRYMAWLEERVLGSRFAHDPHLAVAVGEHLKSVFTGVFDAAIADGHAAERAAATVFGAFTDFPADIRGELLRDERFLSHMGIRVSDTYEHGGLTFDRADFYRAVARAIKGHSMVVAPIGDGPAVALHACLTPGGGPCVWTTNRETGAERPITDGEAELLVASPEMREKALRARRWWLDCDDETLDRLVGRIVVAADPASRFDIVGEWWGTSAALYYADLMRRLQNKDQVRVGELLAPGDEGLRRHLRLPAHVGEGSEFTEALDRAAAQLIREEGLLAAIERLIGLPVPLPNAIIQEIEGLPRKDRRTLIKDLLRMGRSPLSRIHLVHILMRFGNDSVAYRRLVSWIVVRLFSEEGRAELAAFLALLQWIDKEYSRRPLPDGWTPQVRLATVWAHAHRIFAILVGTGASVAALQQGFAQPSRYLSDELFKLMRPDWFDIAHPRRSGDAPLSLVLSGLAYALGDAADAVVSPVFHAADAGDGKSAGSLSAPILIIDPTRARNVLDSFLGRHVLDVYSSLFEMDAGDTQAQGAMRSLMAEAITTLSQQEDNAQAWAILMAILDDLPPYPDVAERLHILLRALPIADLIDRDETAGMAALAVSSRQAMHAVDLSLRSHVEGQLVEIARRRASKVADGASGQGDGVVDDGGWLFMEAVRICAASPSTSAMLNDLARVLTALIDAWPILASLFRPLVQRLHEELPVSESPHLVPLLVRLRASVALSRSPN